MFNFISHDVILQICDAVNFMYRKVQDFFKVASKPFATQEVTANATVPQQQQDLPDSFPKSTADKMLVQFVALSIKVQATIKFVYHEMNKLTIWDRLDNLNSLCKVIGDQSICLAINYMKIKQFLLLSNAMDLNYTTNSSSKENTTSLCKSIPSFLASFAVWYQGFIKYDQVHHLLLSYDQCMRISVDQFQQADMKPQRQFIITKSGERVNHETGLIIAGQAGTNCQNAQSNNQGKYSQSTFANQLTFVKQPAFVNQSAFDNQPTFANQSTINNHRHSISQNAFRPVSLASFASWYQFFYNPQVIPIEIF
jgi:glucose-6-phosphate isomerase